MPADEQLEELGSRLDALLRTFSMEFDVTPTQMAWLLGVQQVAVLAAALEDEEEIEDELGDGDDWKRG